MSDWKEAPEADGSSHAELTAGAERLEKLQTLPVRETALLTTGRESCIEFGVASKDGFWKFSVGNKRVMKKISDIDKVSLYLRNSIILRLLLSGSL